MTRRLLACALLLAALALPAEGRGQSYIPPSQWSPTVSTLAVTAVSAANASVTATLPAAGAGLFHYLTAVQVTRTCTTAITGSAVLTATTTNLPGSIAFTMGNACPVGTTNRDVDLQLVPALRSSAANTASTVVCPAIGATGICRINVVYYTGP